MSERGRGKRRANSKAIALKPGGGAAEERIGA